MMRLILFVFALLCTSPLVIGSPQCLDQGGSPVDWWVMLKLPIMKDSSNPTLQQGYGYAYADSNNALELTSNALNDNDGPLANTLLQIYEGSPDEIGWIMYNDESPNGDSHDSYGHTKGDVALDEDGGFWLVHSVPRFPNYTSHPYEFPANERKYGQSFLCMSLDIDEFTNVGNALLLNKPAVFDINLPSSVVSAVPSLGDVQAKRWNKSSNPSASTIVDTGGQKYTVFAVSGEAELNLYSQVVEPHFQSGMYVETWMNGENSNKMPTYCTPTYPFDTINIRVVGIGNEQWKETQDHSKYGYMKDSNVPFTCIGDKNRQFSQAKRGGGTVCFKNSAIYEAFSGLVVDADSC